MTKFDRKSPFNGNSSLEKGGFKETAYWHVFLDGISPRDASSFQKGLVNYLARTNPGSARVFQDGIYCTGYVAALIVDPIPKDALFTALNYLQGRSYQDATASVKEF